MLPCPLRQAVPRIAVVPPSELGAAELEAWHALLRAGSGPANPFLCPEFTLAVGRLRDHVRVAAVEDGGRVAGFFPFERHRMGVGKPVGAGLTDAQGAILAPGLELDPATLLRACELSVWEFDHLVGGQFAAHHSSRHPSPVMDLSTGFAAYTDAITGKTYKTTLYKERKLGRDVGPVEHRYATADQAVLRTLTGWKTEQYRRTGRTDRFARYSPGLIQHLNMARQAAGRGIALIDLGRGEKEYKEKLKTGELQVAEGRLARATSAAGLHWLVRTPVRGARNAVLATPALRVPADRALKGFGRLRTSLRR